MVSNVLSYLFVVTEIYAMFGRCSFVSYLPYFVNLSEMLSLLPGVPFSLNS
jgi:hypothetical protein